MTAIDDRIAARRQEVRDERRRARLRRTRLVGGLLLLLVGLALLERSPLVALDEIEVTGVQRLTDAQVIAAADIPLGTSTLRLGLDDAAARVTALPLVREATARRLDPLSIRIEVTERQPVLVADDGQRTLLIDRDGVVMAEGEVAGLPIVAVPAPVPAPGRSVDGAPSLANAHAAWRGLSGPLRAQVERYEARGPDELLLHLTSGIEVRFGRAERLAEKVRALGAVLEDVGSTPITRIDVRAPAAPVISTE